MLVLFCVQVVQSSNNECDCTQAKDMQSCQKKQKNWVKNLINKIHKLIIKEVRLDVNCHIKIGRNYNLLQV